MYMCMAGILPLDDPPFCTGERVSIAIYQNPEAFLYPSDSQFHFCHLRRRDINFLNTLLVLLIYRH